MLKSTGGCGEDCGGGEGEEGIGILGGVCVRVCPWEGTSDIACASVTAQVVVDPLKVESHPTESSHPCTSKGPSLYCTCDAYAATNHSRMHFISHFSHSCPTSAFASLCKAKMRQITWPKVV